MAKVRPLTFFLLLFSFACFSSVFTYADDDGDSDEHIKGGGEDSFLDETSGIGDAAREPAGATGSTNGLSIKLSEPTPAPTFDAPSGMEQVRAVEAADPKDDSFNVPADVVGNR